MDKSPDAFRTISEVADWLGTPAHVLRFWESRFSQVKPVKRAGGRRYYRPSDMVLLGGIKKLLHDDGLTIRGVQKLLREHGVRYVASLSPHIEGVEPVVPLSESVGPIPNAPMAVDVPTGAFDTPLEEQIETVVPFSRPDIPPQPAPPTASDPTPGQEQADTEVAQVPFDFASENDQAPDAQAVSGEMSAAEVPESDLFAHGDFEPSDTAQISDHPNEVAQSTMQETVPEDPSDDAAGLAVKQGVLGRIDGALLASAQTESVQKIYDRASALLAKVSQPL